MKLAIVAGAFNPVTRAHMAIADAAAGIVDEVFFAIPRAFPHKPIEGASLDARVEMLYRAGAKHVEITEGGLLIDIGREARRLRPNAEIYLACGRDTAERIIEWKYEDASTLDQLFQEFRLLVAGRQGEFRAPKHLRSRIHPLVLAADVDEIASSEVRRRLEQGEPWEHLVPSAIVDLVRETYGAKPA